MSKYVAEEKYDLLGVISTYLPKISVPLVTLWIGLPVPVVTFVTPSLKR